MRANPDPLSEARFDPLRHPRDRRGRWRDVPTYIASILPNAHLVGGAVRDEVMGRPVKDHDFLAPGMGHTELRAALEPHGRVDDLVVDERKVGVRFYPDVRGLPESGIEIAPPRTERSTGKGRHDFEIVADASVPVEQDMERRDFTINAMAKNITTGEIVDPLGGEADAKNKVLRVINDESFRDDGLRIARGLRFISQLGLTPDETTRQKMGEWARRINDVSGERLGGGADGELSKLLMGPEPARALREARDTGVLEHFLPDVHRTVGFEQQSKYHGLSLDEHTFEVVQAAADNGASLEVRLAALFHDVGKVDSAWEGLDGNLHYYGNPELGKQAHEDVGATTANRALRKLKYPRTTIDKVRVLVRQHMFQDHAKPTPAKARRFLSNHGNEMAFNLIAHKRADVIGKESDSDERIADEMVRLDKFEKMLRQERHAPTKITDLAIDGDDLMALGFPAGPELGAALKALLNHVLGNPGLNTREWLLAEAARILKKGGLQEADSAGSFAAANFERLHPRGRKGQWVDKPVPREMLHGLIEHLRMVFAMRSKNMQFKAAENRGPEEVIFKHGKIFRGSRPTVPHDFPKEVCVGGECFSNALKIAALGYFEPEDEFTYVEGYALPGAVPFPVHHAWIVDKEGHVYDPTWAGQRRGIVYVGVPFTTEFMRKEALRRRTDTILDEHFPYYEKKIPKGVIADVPGEPVAKWLKDHAKDLTDWDAQMGKLREAETLEGDPTLELEPEVIEALDAS